VDSFEQLAGADARKVILFLAVMAVHAVGEGGGVGVSFAGDRGWAQVSTPTSSCSIAGRAACSKGSLQDEQLEGRWYLHAQQALRASAWQTQYQCITLGYMKQLSCSCSMQERMFSITPCQQSTT
jgi:hypothetical protein